MPTPRPSKPFRTILAATDFSGTGGAAVRRGIEVARRLDARLHLVHVTPDTGSPELNSRLKERAEKRLERMAGAATVAARFRVVRGIPEEGVLAECKRVGADLIVLGYHGFGGPSGRSPVGRNSARILQQAPCSVLVVKNRSAARYRHFLVAVDMGLTYRNVLKTTGALARSYAARITALHVAENNYQSEAELLLTPSQLQEMLLDREKVTQKSRSQLDKFGDMGLEHRFSSAVRVGRPAPRISAFAKEKKADLIILGARGGRFANAARLGPTTLELLPRIDTDVLLVRPRGAPGGRKLGGST